MGSSIQLGHFRGYGASATSKPAKTIDAATMRTSSTSNIAKPESYTPQTFHFNQMPWMWRITNPCCECKQRTTPYTPSTKIVQHQRGSAPNSQSCTNIRMATVIRPVAGRNYASIEGRWPRCKHESERTGGTREADDQGIAVSIPIHTPSLLTVSYEQDDAYRAQCIGTNFHAQGQTKVQTHCKHHRSLAYKEDARCRQISWTSWKG